MKRGFGDVPVYTKDSVITTDDSKKKQAVIDEWTDELANSLAYNTYVTITDDGMLHIERQAKHRGGQFKIVYIWNLKEEFKECCP